MELTRRNFIKVASLAACGVAGAGASLSRLTTEDLEVVEVPITLPRLPTVFSGYRIGLVSDLHLGVCVRSEFIEQVVSQLRDLKPDLLLLGGDYIYVEQNFRDRVMEYPKNEEFLRLESYKLPPLIYSRIADLISAIQPPDGIFAVFGNHDRWISSHLCQRAFSMKRISVLTNQSVVVRRAQSWLRVTGLDDYWTGVPYAPVYDDSLRRSEVRIVFTHNPDLYSSLLRRNKVEFDLGLAGHTHGGQIVLPGIGALKYNIKDLRFRCGLFEYDDKFFYTTRGIGVVAIPCRINCRPEVTLISLRGA